MKRNVFLCLLVILLVFSLIGCDNGNENNSIHTHSYGNWTTKTEANCLNSKVEKRVCSCGEEETRTIDSPLGHDWIWINTSDGIETKTCHRYICHETDGIILTLELGDVGPGGGKIFYLNENGFLMFDDNSTAHYLEVAPDDMDTKLMWSSLGFNETSILGTQQIIGTGRSNTMYILEIDAEAPAAKACNNYINNSKNDWFLPSIDELDILYKSSIGNMKNDFYLSSSQHSAWNMHGQWFSNGFQSNGGLKTDNCLVRAIRAF